MKNIQLQNAFPPVEERFERSMQRAFKRLREEENMKHRISTRRIVLLAAAFVLLIAAAGLAAGVIRSAFSRMTCDGYAGDPQTDYEELDRLAQLVPSEQTVSFSGNVSAEFSLEQSYYNGEQLVLGLRYRGPETVEFFERGDPRFAEVHPAEETFEVDGYTTYQSEVIDLERHFSGEVVQEVYDRVINENWAGMFWYELWLGDGVYIPDVSSTQQFWDGSTSEIEHTRLSPHEDRDWNVIGSGQRYIEFETPLPDAARNQESLELMCKLYLRPTWFIYEGEPGNVECYIGYGETEVRELRFELFRNDEYAEESIQAEAEFPNHKASVIVKTTPIYVQVELENHLPEKWMQAWTEHAGYYVPPLNLDADLAFNYEVYADCGGAGFIEVLGGLENVDGVCRLTGRFILPKGTKAIILRPVYANSGAHPEEDVRIDLPA